MIYYSPHPHIGIPDTPLADFVLARAAERGARAALVDSVDKGGRHLVLRAPHPSPLSAHSGFFGCRHFSKTNAFLESRGLAPIDWKLPEAIA